MPNIQIIGNMSLASSSSSRAIEITGIGFISIQPILLEAVTGSPTYTFEVSNDGVTFVEYDLRSTNVNIQNSVEIHSKIFPWRYIRISVTSNTGDLGSVEFKIYEGGESYPLI